MREGGTECWGCAEYVGLEEVQLLAVRKLVMIIMCACVCVQVCM